MRPIFAQLCTLWLLATPSSRALAHGAVPEVVAILSHDAEGPRAVLLSTGVALRRTPTRYQFVCPAAWGDQFPASVAALPGGALLVGAARGLMLLHEDGSTRAHPDPAAADHRYEVVRSAYGVFATRFTPLSTDVFAVDEQTMRALWTDPEILYSLSADDDKLVLLRAGPKSLQQITLSAQDGAELERQQAMFEPPLDDVFARAGAEAPYALILLRTGASLLGTLRMNVFSQIAEGTRIAGPLRTPAGTVIAVDGALSLLLDGGTQRLADDHDVRCLGHDDALTYACDRDGVLSMNDLGLGQALFRMSWLTGPNLEQLAEVGARTLCSTQWQDLRADLALAGTTLDEDAPLDAGVDASSGMETALPTLDASSDDAGATVRLKNDSSCGLQPDALPSPWAPSGLLLALLRRRKRASRPTR